MMHFRRKSKHGDGEKEQPSHMLDVKVSKQDQERLKVRTASVADPILEAVQEAQPFEQAADTFHDNMNRQSYFTGSADEVLRDVFGQPIHQPDISNPTRARDERPLDTIRSFEYAITGDPSWGQQLETPQLGFRVRPDFPYFGNSNPYGNSDMAQQQQQYSQQMYGEQAVYQAPVATPEEGKKKKKKRNFFGRKKKDA